MRLSEFFEKRLLRKIAPDMQKTTRSLEISKKYLDSSTVLLKTGSLNFVIVAAYTSMFHAARALLYKDGIQEKSHYAVFAYIKAKYSEEIGKDLIFEFNTAREQRHEGLYGIEYDFDKDDVTSIIKAATRFYKKTSEIIGQQSRK